MIKFHNAFLNGALALYPRVKINLAQNMSLFLE
jgi:hypothetical protein